MKPSKGIISLARDWGACVRAFERRATGIQGTMGRIADDPMGATIRTANDHIPIRDFPEEARRFHQAWLDLEKIPQSIIYADYKMLAPSPKKWEILGLKRWKYYKLRDTALVGIDRMLYYYDDM